MPKPNRRRVLVLTGSALAGGLAGCSGGGSGDTDSPTATGEDAGTDTPGGESGGTDSPTATGDDAGTATPGGETPNTQVPDGDATVTLSIDGGAPEFETLIIDFDRIVFRGDTDTDDATVQIGDSGLDMTTLPEDGKTYLDEQPFPSGYYTTADCFLTVQEATLSDGGEATFTGDSPVPVDLVLSDDPLDILSGSTKDITFSMTANKSYNEAEFSFNTGFSSIG